MKERETDELIDLLCEQITTPELLAAAGYGEISEGCLVPKPNIWLVTDGSDDEDRVWAETAADAAEQWVSGGDWGEHRVVSVRVCRRGYDGDGDEVDVDEEEIDIDVGIDHGALIRAAMGDEGCGDDPDAHSWSREGEGGCDENPGVWSLGGTTILIREHCERCGLGRETTHNGSQRNPGEPLEVVEYSVGGDPGHVGNDDEQ